MIPYTKTVASLFADKTSFILSDYASNLILPLVLSYFLCFSSNFLMKNSEIKESIFKPPK
jgi:hypothetical protein